MKIYLCLKLAVFAGVSSLVVSSCAYDPYYSGGSTSAFISTGNSQWGYDPTYHAYYDYNRRAYYDPYLNGYYPVGYRPQRVYGSPHPYGWSGRRNRIAPPGNVRNYNLTNYKRRDDRYRNLGRSWSRDVRSGPSSGNNRSVFFNNQQNRNDYKRGNTIVTRQPQRSNTTSNGFISSRSGPSPAAQRNAQIQQRQQQARTQQSRFQQARQQQQRQTRPQPQQARQQQQRQSRSQPQQSRPQQQARPQANQNQPSGNGTRSRFNRNSL